MSSEKSLQDIAKAEKKMLAAKRKYEREKEKLNSLLRYHESEARARCGK